jgi:hypothetical protein
MGPWPDDAEAIELGGGRYSIAPKDHAIAPDGSVGVVHTVCVEAEGDVVRLVDEGTRNERARLTLPAFDALDEAAKARVGRELVRLAGVRVVTFFAAGDE